MKNGDYIAVKVALNSNEEYNLDQEVLFFVVGFVLFLVLFFCFFFFLGKKKISQSSMETSVTHYGNSVIFLGKQYMLSHFKCALEVLESQPSKMTGLVLFTFLLL